MEPIKLKFRARGHALVADLASMTGADGAQRRYVGRKFDATLGKAGGWPHADEPQEVMSNSQFAGEYLLSVRHGDLWPADQATADWCGAKFDPDFGGELDTVHDVPTPAAPSGHTSDEK